jgi:autotransporter-associated beta strand protein
LTKLNTGTLTLLAVNTNSGSTTISAGTLALSGTAGLPNTSLISIAGGATFSVSGLTSTFVLGSSQTLSNNASATGTITCNLNTATGTVSVSYTNGTPALTVSNGTLTLAAGTVFKINNTGPALAGSTTNRIISKGSGGIVAGTAPTTVTVSGGGAAAAASLQIIGGELFLVVAPAAPSTPPNFPPGGITVSGSGIVSLVATGAVGGTYSLWATTNLALSPVTNTWTRLLTNAIIATSPFTNLDMKATNYPQRFYLFSNP